jgi:hypothetical protein
MERNQMDLFPNALAIYENGDIILKDIMCKNTVAINMAGVGVGEYIGKLEYPCTVAVVPPNLPDGLLCCCRQRKQQKFSLRA